MTPRLLAILACAPLAACAHPRAVALHYESAWLGPCRPSEHVLLSASRSCQLTLNELGRVERKGVGDPARCATLFANVDEALRSPGKSCCPSQARVLEVVADVDGRPRTSICGDGRSEACAAIFRWVEEERRALHALPPPPGLCEPSDCPRRTASQPAARERETPKVKGHYPGDCDWFELENEVVTTDAGCTVTRGQECRRGDDGACAWAAFERRDCRRP
jgi:hypothetical protein